MFPEYIWKEISSLSSLADQTGNWETEGVSSGSQQQLKQPQQLQIQEEPRKKNKNHGGGGRMHVEDAAR